MLQQNFRSRNFIISLIFILFMCACSNGDDEVVIQETPQPAEDTTTTTVLSQPAEDTTTTTVLSQPVEEECIPIDNSSISLGTTKDIQTFLYNNGFNPGEIDGYLGSATMDAIKQFQANVGLEADGDVGPNTLQAMRLWTGCEDITIQTTTTTVAQSTTSTTTTSTTTTLAL